MERILALRKKIGRLEIEQHTNKQLLAKQLESSNLKMLRTGDALEEAKCQLLEQLQSNNDSMATKLLDKQHENHSLAEQLAVAQSREQQLTKELDMLRSVCYNNERVTLTLQQVETVLKRVETQNAAPDSSQLQSALLERDKVHQLAIHLNERNAEQVNGLKANLGQACADRDKALAEVKLLQSNFNVLDNVYQRLKDIHERLREEMEQIHTTADTNLAAYKKEIQAVRDQLEKDLASRNITIEQLRNELAGKEMEVLEQATSLCEAMHTLEHQRANFEQALTTLENSEHEAQLKIVQYQAQIERLEGELEQNSARYAELSEANIRLSANLATEIAKTADVERQSAISYNQIITERDAATKELSKCTKQNKYLLNRYNGAMAITAKNSPELVVTSLAQLTELETKVQKLCSELTTVRGFARKFQDERNKLEQDKMQLETAMNRLLTVRKQHRMEEEELEAKQHQLQLDRDEELRAAAKRHLLEDMDDGEPIVVDEDGEQQQQQLDMPKPPMTPEPPEKFSHALADSAAAAGQPPLKQRRIHDEHTYAQLQVAVGAAAPEELKRRRNGAPQNDANDDEVIFVDDVCRQKWMVSMMKREEPAKQWEEIVLGQDEEEKAVFSNAAKTSAVAATQGIKKEKN